MDTARSNGKAGAVIYTKGTSYYGKNSTRSRDWQGRKEKGGVVKKGKGNFRANDHCEL